VHGYLPIDIDIDILVSTARQDLPEFVDAVQRVFGSR
jgi:hypothetical protein